MNDTINKIKELQQSIKDTMKSLEASFKEGLLKFMIENDIESFDIRVNNHEFNDGDLTYFSLYYEYLEIEDLSEEVCSKITNFFSLFDVDGFYESIFGDIHEYINFSVKNGKLIIK